VQHILPQFQQDNPQLLVESLVRRGKHPGLQAEYRECQDAAAVAGARSALQPSLMHLHCTVHLSADHLPTLHMSTASLPARAASPLSHPDPCCRTAAVNKSTRHVDVKNAAAEEVLRQAVYLRSSLGRKASLQASIQLRGATPSLLCAGQPAFACQWGCLGRPVVRREPT
jgi:hypothetical protein